MKPTYLKGKSFVELSFIPTEIDPNVGVLKGLKMSNKLKKLIKFCFDTSASFQWYVKVESDFGEKIITPRVKVIAFPSSHPTNIGVTYDIECFFYLASKLYYFNKKILDILGVPRTVKHFYEKDSPCTWTQDGALLITYPKNKRKLFLKVYEESQKSFDPKEIEEFWDKVLK